jgi:hypothetical protein
MQKFVEIKQRRHLCRIRQTRVVEINTKATGCINLLGSGYVTPDLRADLQTCNLDASYWTARFEHTWLRILTWVECQLFWLPEGGSEVSFQQMCRYAAFVAWNSVKLCEMDIIVQNKVPYRRESRVSQSVSWNFKVITELLSCQATLSFQRLNCFIVLVRDLICKGRTKAQRV